MRTGTFTLPYRMSLNNVYREVDFYGVDRLSALIQHKINISNITSVAGGIYFISKLPLTSNNNNIINNSNNNNRKILHAVIKANIMALYFNDGYLEIWMQV